MLLQTATGTCWRPRLSRNLTLRPQTRYVDSLLRCILIRNIIRGSNHLLMTAGKPRDVSLSLAPTNGIRALCCIGIVVAHCMYWVSLAYEDKAALYKGYAANTWMNFVLHNAEPTMDAFLVLTGFLAVRSLIPALESSTNMGGTIFRYYKKRLVRIVPAYYGVLVFLHAYVLPQSDFPELSPEMRRSFFDRKQPFDTAVCRKMGWTNFLFANNRLPNGGCYNTTWSLAVQMQFYAILPLTLLVLRPRTPGFRGRAGCVAAGIFVLTLVYRGIVFAMLRLWDHMPLPFFGPFTPDNEPTLDLFALYLYLSFFVRLGHLCLGALAALAATSTGVRSSITRHKGKLLAAMAVLFLSCAFGSAQLKIGLSSDPTHALADPVLLGFAMIIQTGFVSPLVTVLALVLTTTGQAGLPKLLADALSSQPLLQLADISYDIYLLHPLVIYIVWSVLPPSTWFSFSEPAAFALVAFLVLALSAAAGWVQHVAWNAIIDNVGHKWGTYQASKVNLHVRAGKGN